MDQQTRAALKQDKFVATTTHGLEWATEHRQAMMRNGAIALAAIAVIVVGALIYNNRANAASVAFGSAMQVYQTPLTPVGQPVPPGVKTFGSAAERAKAANAQFVAVADKYSMMPDGENARYFAGLTYMDEGQNQSAEDALKKVAGGWNSNLAALAKLALAQLYHNTGRDQQAIDMYNQLSAKPTTTVPFGLARLQLADLYQSQGKADEAKKVYADLKDKDPKGPAGAMAAEKLNGPGAAAGPRLGLSQ